VVSCPSYSHATAVAETYPSWQRLGLHVNTPRRALIRRLDDRVFQRASDREGTFSASREKLLAVVHVRDITLSKGEDLWANLRTDAIADATPLINPNTHATIMGRRALTRDQAQVSVLPRTGVESTNQLREEQLAS
jgi:hypothetical protein